jgi:hypothetical protein
MIEKVASLIEQVRGLSEYVHAESSLDMYPAGGRYHLDYTEPAALSRGC